MHYFHGFSLQGEEALFEEIIPQGEHTVAGFSYGAQEALEYAYHTSNRVDRLILISPAFFQNQKSSFVRTQLRYFSSDKRAYIQQFAANVASPSSFSLDAYLQEGSKEELEALLSYVWDEQKIKTLEQKGTKIEVFIGKEDKIIDAHTAIDFFKPLVTLYIFNQAGHLLRS